ncbi:MAG: phosphate acyltransferase [Desulfomicrobium escambiense]|nr:phosphate acyltransferase [Desulfomicrobium escambiense]
MEQAQPSATLPEILALCRKLGKVRISVAAAEDEDVLRAVWAARDAGIAEAVLVGDRGRIEAIAAKAGISSLEIVHEPDPARAARAAAAWSGRAGRTPS